MPESKYCREGWLAAFRRAVSCSRHIQRNTVLSMKHHTKHQSQLFKPKFIVTIWTLLVGLLVVEQFLAHHSKLSSWQQQQQHMHAVHTQAVHAHAADDQAISGHGGTSKLNHADISKQTESACGDGSRPSVALLMVILGHQNETRHGQYWLAVANRRAYALEHGFPLYLVNEQLGSGQHAAWKKLIAVQAVFQHSCADWVWISDADAYVMTLKQNILDLAQNPKAYHHPKHVCSSNSPDIIAASACITHINTGSMLWHNSNFTRHFITDAWHSKFIARPAGWWDQAAILHMYKVAHNKEHICIVKQGAINAYPTGNACNDGFGNFKEGDMLVHFPGGLKKAIASMDSNWLHAVPIVPSKAAVATRAQVYTLSAAAVAAAAAATGDAVQQSEQHPHADVAAAAASANNAVPPVQEAVPVPQSVHHSDGHSNAEAQSHGLQQQIVHVRMYSSLYAQQSDMPTDFDVAIQPQQQGYDNWGWPVEPEPTQAWVKLKQLPGLQHDAAAAAAAA